MLGTARLQLVGEFCWWEAAEAGGFRRVLTFCLPIGHVVLEGHMLDSSHKVVFEAFYAGDALWRIAHPT
jgi:hypothetical protein